MTTADIMIESLPPGAGVVHLGALSFVSPWPEFRATASQLAKLETAALIWESPLLAGLGQKLCDEVEGEMAREAKRRAKMAASDRIIVPPRPQALRIGEPALFVDDGKAERVLVLSEVWPHEESGEPMRTCSFLDQGGEQYDVKAGNLEPADGGSGGIQPDALVTPRWTGVESLERDGGRVYAPEPYQARLVRPHPAMEKFDRVAPVKPEDVRLDIAKLTDNQRVRLKQADRNIRQAESRKAHRMKVVAGRTTYGRMTQSEKDERRQAKDIYDQLQAEVLAGIERDALSRGRVEALALARLSDETLAVDATTGRLTRKNGLDTLLASGAIDLIDWRAGDKYAEVFAEAQSSLKVANWEGAGGGSAPNPEQERLRRLADLANKQRLTDIETIVRSRVKSPRALSTLRLVAGEGRHVSHFSKGAGRAKNVAALKDALGALAAIRGWV